mgnify:CR=1 FL=1
MITSFNDMTNRKMMTSTVARTLALTAIAFSLAACTTVFESDKVDYKATIVNQAADKIVMKIPQVKPGGYNVSIQVGNGILIEPVRFTVQQ